jgi:ubiquinone/menaquinone biosynthesis C-methylase UbiE
LYSSQAMGFESNETFQVQSKSLAKLRKNAKTNLPWSALDLGCGAGYGSKNVFLSEENLINDYEIQGLDVSPEAVATYKKITGFTAKVGSVTNTGFDDASFNVVLFDDVIEHLVDTDLAFREIHRILKPGGYLFISTPNLASWFNRLALLLGIQPAFSEVSCEKIYGRPGREVVGHLRLFTLRSLTEMLSQEGFSIREIKSSIFDALPMYLTPFDRIFTRFPSLGANLILVCEKI